MRILIGILLLLLLWLQYRLWVGQGSLAEVHNLKQEMLEAEVLDLKQGLEAIEERARTDLGMTKRGEVFYQVIEPEGGAAK